MITHITTISSHITSNPPCYDSLWMRALTRPPPFLLEPSLVPRHVWCVQLTRQTEFARVCAHIPLRRNRLSDRATLIGSTIPDMRDSSIQQYCVSTRLQSASIRIRRIWLSKINVNLAIDMSLRNELSKHGRRQRVPPPLDSLPPPPDLGGIKHAVHSISAPRIRPARPPRSVVTASRRFAPYRHVVRHNGRPRIYRTRLPSR